jgi:deazaflavin-dependent oxidoreductase (nitroreductase family)
MAEIPADIHEHNRKLIEEFRANGRRLGDRPILVLTTTGRRTGQSRPTPMMYVRDGTDFVIASNAGAPKHPDWYRNLVADPEVTVEVDGEEYRAVARPLTGREYAERWADISGRYPFFAEHQAGVTRRIPVVALDRQ